MTRVICLLMVYFLGIIGGYSQAKVKKNATKQTAAKKKTVTPKADSVVIAPSATREARVAYYRKVQNEYVNIYLSSPLHKDTEKDWMKAFDGIMKTGFRSSLSTNRLHYAFADITNRTVAFQESLLSLLCASYPVEFEEEVRSLMNNTTTLRVFAFCVEYLLLNQKDNQNISFFNSLLDQKMSSESNNPIFRFLKQKLEDKRVFQTPPLKDLLKYDFIKNNIVLFSIQRKNRDFPGLLLIRTEDGKFLRNADNSIFWVQQSAKSITGLPFYFNEGNTPQGIYRLGGIETVKDEFVGPTPAIKLLLPYEAKPSTFIPIVKDTAAGWLSTYYRSMLPASWLFYEPIYESYYVGMAGRRGIRAHGSTLNPEYYAGKPWYPLTLFTGSLTTKELWDDKTGARFESDQQKLIDAILKLSKRVGYFVVVEINDKEEPVNIKELENILQNIDAGIKQ